MLFPIIFEDCVTKSEGATSNGPSGVPHCQQSTGSDSSVGECCVAAHGLATRALDSEAVILGMDGCQPYFFHAPPSSPKLFENRSCSCLRHTKTGRICEGNPSDLHKLHIALQLTCIRLACVRCFTVVMLKSSMPETGAETEGPNEEQEGV